MQSTITTTCEDDPWQLAEELYKKYPQKTTLKDDIYLHLRIGLVYSDCKLLLLAIPTNREQHLSGNPPLLQSAPSDSWWITLCVGELEILKALFNSREYRLPYVGWTRRNGRSRFYIWEDLWKKLNSISHLRHLSPQFPPPDTSWGEGVQNKNLPQPQLPQTS